MKMKIKPILVRPSPELRRRLEKEAKEQQRSLNNLLIIIATRFFTVQDSEAQES